MVRSDLFQTSRGPQIPAADATNAAGGPAYARSNEQALAQYACTGTLGGTFYASAEGELAKLMELANACDPLFVAKTAVYAREHGRMKDAPALLCAVLAKRNLALLRGIFDRVIDDGKMLRNFVQIIRSGATGRKSFGTGPKKLVQGWFDRRTETQLFHASIGNTPSLADIIKMVHPKPKTEARRAMHDYLLGRLVTAGALLPDVVQQFEAFKRGEGDVPDISFLFLSSLPLTDEQWKAIARKCSWTTLRMNLNTFARHNVLGDTELLASIIRRLQDPTEIARAKPMPYQLFTAYQFVDDSLPPGIRMALAQATDLALSNTPELPANTAVVVDVSGSMKHPVTGSRGTATTKMRCVDVAALIACAILRRNPTTRVVPVDTQVHASGFVGGSVVESAQRLAAFGGGGTSLSAALVHIAETMPKVDLVVMVSDNESWMDPATRGTASMAVWNQIRARNPDAKIVCIDLTPNTTAQLKECPGVANVGGFSDAVFDFLAQFVGGGTDWKKLIEAVEVPVFPK